MTPLTALPIDRILPNVIASLRDTPNLVIEAPPGAGKTTRVPPALLPSVRGDILVLEPRRIAARMAARRVAHELGESVGETVGFQVRFEEVAGPRTRLRFLTEGVLTRRFLSDPRLPRVGAVILDEFHERHLETDLALALLKRLQATSRPELKLIVMSATLEADPVAKYLNGCPVLRSEGRLFDLTVTHLPYSPKPLEEQVAVALDLLLSEQHSGDILVFLPGAAEIRRAARACDPIARRASLLLLPLHGDLSPEEQDRAVSPATQRKVILSTNVAESSITIDGVTAVIDSGLARIASDSPWTGLPTLQVGRVSKASAKQRAGRAGRTAPGRVIRLYTKEDFERRPEHDAPEITRRELSQLCLDLRAIGGGTLHWLTPPPAPAIEAAEKLLERLDATGPAAAQIARYPLHPRLSRMVIEGLRRGVGEDACVVAALLGSGARLEKSDLLAALDSEWDYRTRQHIEQLRRVVRPPKQTRHDDDALLMSILAGFPDRVARRRKGNQVLLSSGGSAELAGEPPPYEFMVAADIEDRKDKPLPLVRLTARIEPEWLIDLFPDRVEDRNGVEWNRAAERVEAVSAMVYDDLTIQESHGAVPTPEAAAALLAQKAIEAGIERFADREQLEEFQVRVEFAGLKAPDATTTVERLCLGLRSFADLKALDLMAALEQQVDSRLLNERAPARIRLPNGRQTKVHYERGKPPWVASRLQDFIGMRETPRVGGTPLVVHLLAPNQRPVQTTTDLAGFWERLYPELRRQLSRRYPKHAWPQKP
jgi:ATP-dependent helicase HrpB